MRSRSLHEKADGRGSRAARFGRILRDATRSFEKELQLRFSRAVAAQRIRARNQMCGS